jgi:hypothetical protein
VLNLAQRKPEPLLVDQGRQFAGMRLVCNLQSWLRYAVGSPIVALSSKVCVPADIGPVEFEALHVEF